MKLQKTLGIIGGMGSQATAYTLDRIVKLTPASNDQEHIEILLHNNSHVPDRTRGILYGGPSPLPELLRSIATVNSYGVDYVIMACMTAHYFIRDLQQESAAKIINAISETAEYTSCNFPDVKRVGLLATTGSIQLEIFQQEFARRQIETAVLDDDDQQTYFMEPVYAQWGIKAGGPLAQPKELMCKAVAKLIAKRAEAIIAGCTEVPLVLSPQDMAVPFLDTIDILAKAAIRKCLGE